MDNGVTEVGQIVRGGQVGDHAVDGRDVLLPGHKVVLAALSIDGGLINLIVDQEDSSFLKEGFVPLMLSKMAFNAPDAGFLVTKRTTRSSVRSRAFNMRARMRVKGDSARWSLRRSSRFVGVSST